MTAQQETSSLEVVLDDIDNAIARKRILEHVLRARDKVGIPRAAYDFVSSSRHIIDGLAKVELVFFLPETKKVQAGTAVIGGDLELTINVWAMPLDHYKGITVVSSNKKVVDDVERCEVHVIAPLSSAQAGVIW